MPGDPHTLTNAKERKMLATVLYKPGDIRCEEVADPKILRPTDAIIKLSASCICGSDLWPYRGLQPVEGPMHMGHEILRRRGRSRQRGAHDPSRPVCRRLLLPSGFIYFGSLALLDRPIASAAALFVGRAVLGVAESFVITGGVAWGLALAGGQHSGKVIAWVGMAMFAALALGAPIGSARLRAPSAPSALDLLLSGGHSCERSFAPRITEASTTSAFPAGTE